MWLFLVLVVGVVVSRSHLQVGYLWPVLLALFFLVIVLGGLLLADAANVAVSILDRGVSDSWARYWGFVPGMRSAHVYFWFVMQR